MPDDAALPAWYTDHAALDARCRQSALYAWSQGQASCPEFGQVIYLCPTNLCNHRCITCGYPKMRKGKNAAGEHQRGIMAWDIFAQLTEQFPREGRRVYFQKTGEPLMHPRILDMLAHFRSRQAQHELALHTNIARMTDAHMGGLLELLDFLSLSIFGFDRASYRRAHGKDDFDRVVARLDALHSLYLRSRRVPKVYFDVVRCAANAHLSNEAIFHFLAARYPAFNIGIHFPYNFQDTVPGIEFDISAHLAETDFPSCVHPYVMCNILWDGKVGYCVGDPYEEAILGDIRQKPLQTIWNDTPFLVFRAAMHGKRWKELLDSGIRCFRCNWLFALKSQSMENLCLVNRRHLPAADAGLPNGIAATSRDHLTLGLRQYLRGEITAALTSLTFAEIAAEDGDVRERATIWLGKVRDVLRMRARLDRWERALQAMGQSLAKTHVSCYHLADAQRDVVQGLHNTTSTNAVLKKTEI